MRYLIHYKTSYYFTQAKRYVSEVNVRYRPGGLSRL